MFSFLLFLLTGSSLRAKLGALVHFLPDCILHGSRIWVTPNKLTVPLYNLEPQKGWLPWEQAFQIGRAFWKSDTLKEIKNGTGGPSTLKSHSPSLI